MIIEKTINKKIGKEEYTNNLETKKITRNGETLLDYCIIAYDDNNTLTIQKGNMITAIGLQDNPHKDIIKELLQPTKPKKQQKKSSKSTIKGQKKQAQKTKKEDKE